MRFFIMRKILNILLLVGCISTLPADDYDSSKIVEIVDTLNKHSLIIDNQINHNQEFKKNERLLSSKISKNDKKYQSEIRNLKILIQRLSKRVNEVSNQLNFYKRNNNIRQIAPVSDESLDTNKDGLYEEGY